MDKHELRRAGLKATLPRLRILQLLEERTESHMSAEDVYRALLEAGEDVGLATVYRVLTQFEAAGLVARHHFEGGHSVFELNQGEHHDHIVCSECGHIVEFIDQVIEDRQNRVAETHGFRLADHSLVLHGICTDTKCERRGRRR